MAHSNPQPLIPNPHLPHLPEQSEQRLFPALLVMPQGTLFNHFLGNDGQFVFYGPLRRAGGSGHRATG